MPIACDNIAICDGHQCFFIQLFDLKHEFESIDQ